jgi:hypothetical protein
MILYTESVRVKSRDSSECLIVIVTVKVCDIERMRA